MHELSISSAIVDTAMRHADGRPGDRGRRCASARCARWCPSRSTSTSRSSPATRSARARRSSSSWSPRVDALRRTAAASGTRPPAASAGARGSSWTALASCRRSVPRLRAAPGPRSSAGDELEVESIEVADEAGHAQARRRAMHRTKIRVAEDALDANQTIARANRDDFDRAWVAVVNLMSAPGAGKTTLLERGSRRPRRRPRRRARGRRPGDAWTPTGSRAIHVPVVQLNTDSGFGGECHLDANMVRSAIADLPLDELDLLVIENVGNLVCPAEFRVGEDARIMVTSVTEGEDKPLKYPLMFRACELVVVNKIDLLPHLDFDLDRFLANIDAVNPGVETMLVSATHRRGRRRVARVARPRSRTRRGGGGPGLGARWRRPTAGGARRPGRRAARRAHRGQPRVLRAEAGRARALLPPDGRALRPRRPPGRARPFAGGALGRPPRRGRVRPSGDRRQARAAGDRAGRRGRAARRPGRGGASSPTTSRSPSGPTSRTPARRRGAGARRGRAAA